MVLQVLELGVPAVLAVNMADMLEASGERLDLDAMRRELGIPVVACAAIQGRGLEELQEAIETSLTAGGTAPGARWVPREPALAADVEAVAASVPEAWTLGDPARARAIAAWALLSIDESDELASVPEGIRRAVALRRASAALSGRKIDEEI